MPKIRTQVELERLIEELHERYQKKIEQMEKLALELTMSAIRYGETRAKHASLAQALEQQAREEDLEVARAEMHKTQMALNMTVAEAHAISDPPPPEPEHE